LLSSRWHINNVWVLGLNDPMSFTSSTRFAIIAGNGQFPFLTIEAAREQGVEPVVFAIREEASPELAEKTGKIHWLSLGEVGRLMTLLRVEQIEKVVLAGQVKHVQLYSRIQPDPLVREALGTLASRNTEALIGAFVQMLEQAGMEVVDSTIFIEPLLAGAGCLTQRWPDDEELADVKYGREIAGQVSALDIGQTVVVADRACLAVEAMEGTDATIERAATLSNGRRLVVVKVCKAKQDMRFDVPVVGPKTIEVMARSGASTLAVAAGKALLFERDQVITLANRACIAIWGMTD
jgi:UDP-2,3-diacylglucosamine hydrolase